MTARETVPIILVRHGYGGTQGSGGRAVAFPRPGGSDDPIPPPFIAHQKVRSPRQASSTSR
jgi:hypothetical protein